MTSAAEVKRKTAVRYSSSVTLNAVRRLSASTMRFGKKIRLSFCCAQSVLSSEMSVIRGPDERHVMPLVCMDDIERVVAEKPEVEGYRDRVAQDREDRKVPKWRCIVLVHCLVSGRRKPLHSRDCGTRWSPPIRKFRRTRDGFEPESGIGSSAEPDAPQR